MDILGNSEIYFGNLINFENEILINQDIESRFSVLYEFGNLVLKVVNLKN